jgi:Zn-finger nucleic acid-binding protein
MDSEMLGELWVDRCEACGGIWLDPDEFMRLWKAKGAQDRDGIDRLANPLRYSRSYRYRRADYGPSRSSGSFLDFFINLHEFIAEGASCVMSRIGRDAEREKMEAKKRSENRHFNVKLES